MKIEISKKAEALINTFTDRERNCFEYILKLYSETQTHLEKCEFENKTYFDNKDSDLHNGASNALRTLFVLGYIVRTLDLDITKIKGTSSHKLDVFDSLF